jgi:hypothetical protein
MVLLITSSRKAGDSRRAPVYRNVNYVIFRHTRPRRPLTTFEGGKVESYVSRLDLEWVYCDIATLRNSDGRCPSVDASIGSTSHCRRMSGAHQTLSC